MMDPLRKTICGNLSGDWSGSWNYDIPLIPVCETAVTLPVLLLVYGVLICIPYTVRLGFRKNTHKRPLSGLLISETIVLVIIISNGIGQTCIQLFHYVDDDWRFFVLPLSIIFISLVQSLIWHFERIRNAANSSVCFFLNLFSIIVIFARCWNHLTDFWIQQSQTMTFNATSSDAALSSIPPGSTTVTRAPATIQIIDLVILGMCLLLFVLGCFSERMLIYQASIKKKRSSDESTPDCFPKKFPKIGDALPSELEAALQEKSGQNKFFPRDEQQLFQNPSPEDHVSFPSRAVYAWFADLIYRGYRKPLEMSDLWSLDDVHRAHNVAKQFSKHLDLHVVPKQSVNYYQERRRISLLNSITENANCVYQQDDLIVDRRRSNQSILGVGVPVSDRSHTYRSGCVETVMQEDRRASDGCTSRPVNLNQRSGAAAQSTPRNMSSSGKSQRTRLPTQKEESGSGSLKKRESVSTPDSVADPVRVGHGENAFPTNVDPNQVQSAINLQSANPPSVDFAGMSSHNSSVRRSVRIRAGTKLDILPRQSESRSNLIVKRFEEEMALKGRDTGNEKLNTHLQTKILMNSNVLNDASKTEAQGTQETAGSKPQHSADGHKDKQGKWGFIVALIEMFWTRLVWTGLLKLLHDTLLFISPLLLKILLKFMQGDHGEPVWHGYLYAVTMFVAGCTQTLILQRYFRDVNIMGMHLRTVITCAVYRKSLRLSNKARCESTTGQIMNLISSDAQHFTTLMPYVHVVWSGPFQIVVAIVLLWRELGPSVLAGIGVLLLLLPFNAVIARLSKTVQEKKFMAADSRVKMITEILNGIRVIKLYAWEPSFITEVNRLRQKEVHYLRRFAYLQSVSFLWTCAPFLVALSTFGVFVMVSDQNILDAQKAFVSLTLFNILRFPLFMFPMVTSSLIQAYVSGMRLNHFLQLIELNPDSVLHEDTPGVAAVIERGVFGWDSEEEPVLHNISIQFPEGQLTSVVGSVGSGKSSLLHALLGDMERLNGCVNIRGSVAYVSQQPWIFNATLRDNILFLKPYDPVRYEKVIEACGLTPDLQILPNGDMTEIGDKGINLSGGQKQRVSLARACYADADVYLLDDPLSAVDAHVGMHLLNKVFSRSTGILASKTCILTTHSPKTLPFSDRVVLMVDGQISQHGTYRQLLQSRTSQLAEFLSDTVLSQPTSRSRTQTSHSDTQSIGQDVNRNAAPSTRTHPGTQRSTDDVRPSHLACQTDYSPGRRSSSIRSTTSLDGSLLKLDQQQQHHIVSPSTGMLTNGGDVFPFGSVLSMDTQEVVEENQNAAIDTKQEPELSDHFRLTQVEQAKTGSVRWSTFKIYFRNVGVIYCLLILISYPVTHLASFGTSLWLADWSEDSASQSNLSDWLRANPEAFYNQTAYPNLSSRLAEFKAQRDYRLGIYGVLGCVQVITSWVSAIAFAIGHLACVRKLHGLLLAGVLHSPAGFFDKVPQGRVINRFAQDISTLDGPLMDSLKSTFNCFLHCTLTVCTACSINPWIVIPVACLTALYMILQKVYVANSRQLKRIESISRSPIFSHFSETLSGADYIRAYSMTEKYVGINYVRLDANNAAAYASMTAQRWLAVLLEMVGNLLILSVAIFCVLTRGQLSAGFSGLVISYALNLNQSLNWLVRMTAELENNLVCVERIDEYANIEQEAAWEVAECKPPSSWPMGTISFIDYGLRYRADLDLVLKDINLTVKRGERIGIVGRTGSGKSSLVLGLFRMLEAAKGRVVIDGRDISQLGLHDLRKRLTLIPQDPVLFSGTLRFNLDPFDEHEDSEVWHVLELANLKTYVTETANSLGLNMIISEGGSNLSMGQRQLVCLARALLRRTPILVLDEATAAVDPVTDNLIQDTIRKEFSDCTVLTIAHRLNTIMDYDRILVLHDGRMLEVGNPRELIKDANSKFFALAKDAHSVE